MALLRLLAGRLVDGVADHRALLVAAGDARHVAPRERALDQLLEAVAVALLERRALRLPVVGEHDDLVRPRRVAAGPLDVGEVVVELAQGLERVGALEAGVVGDLVVARERGVDRGTPAHHVGEHAGDDQVAHEDAQRRSHQRVDAAAVPARAHVPAGPSEGRDQLEDHLPDEEDQRAGHVVAVREKGPVAGVGPLLRVHAADGEDRLVRLAGEQVAAARAAVDQQADAGRSPALDLRAVGRRRARHQRRGLLLDPAERRDVLVGAEQDPRLAGAGLRREVGLPLGQPVRVLGEPARHRRGVAVTHRALQHGQREPVDLEEDDARDAGLGDDALAAADPPGDADRGRVVRAEKDGDERR